MLINHSGETIKDTWSRFQDEHQLNGEADLIFDLKDSEALEAHIRALRGRAGLFVSSDQTAIDVQPFIDRVDLIALDFPKFADGRAYSTARLLRTRFGFAGELRAVGHVLTDQLDFMARCGCDTFDLDRERDPESVKNALNEMRFVYQASAKSDTPIWLRRHA